MSGWLYLTLSIILETVGTTALKISGGFSSLLPTICTIVCYVLCFFFLGHALKTLDMSLVYAIWGAVGIFLISLIGMFYFHEPMNAIKVISILLIILGTIGLRMSGIH